MSMCHVFCHIFTVISILEPFIMGIYINFGETIYTNW